MKAPLRLDQRAIAWDAVADTYAETFEPFTAVFAIAALDALSPVAGKKLLDVAAGAGALAIEAARRGADVHAVDFSRAMVRHIREHTPKLSRGMVRASCMDGRFLRFPSGSFDMATTVFGAMFFPGRAAAFRRIRRVLRRGGRFAMVTWGRLDRFQPHCLLNHAFIGAGVARAPAMPPDWLPLTHPRRLGAELAAAGFRQVEVTQVTGYWHVPSAEWLWEHTPRMSPVAAAAFRGLSEAEMSRLRQAYIKAASDLHGSGALVLSAEANLACGRA